MAPSLRQNLSEAPTPSWHGWPRSHLCRQIILPHVSMEWPRHVGSHKQASISVYSEPTTVNPMPSLYGWHSCSTFNFRDLSGNFQPTPPLELRLPHKVFSLELNHGRSNLISGDVRACLHTVPMQVSRLSLCPPKIRSFHLLGWASK